MTRSNKSYWHNELLQDNDISPLWVEQLIGKDDSDVLIVKKGGYFLNQYRKFSAKKIFIKSCCYLSTWFIMCRHF